MNSAEYEIMFRAEERHWWYRALHRLILGALDEQLPDWRGNPILDAGCGTGAILAELGNPDQNVGVDLAPEAIAFCRQRGINNVQQADICALPFPDESFAAVICSSVLYHVWVKDVGAALRELRRVLRPGGVLFLNLPAFAFLHSAHDDAVLTARRFTRREVRALLVENGFAINRLTYWTTLLFPLALLARTLGGSSKGRDFPEEGPLFGMTNRIFSKLMALELALLRTTSSLPVGVAIFGIATKQKDASAR